MPIPMPVEERYRPERIASRSRMPGPRSLTRTTRSWGARRPSTAISTLPPPAYMKALRAISDAAVAMRVWSWPSKPRRAAISRARWRTATTSCSCRTKSETRGRLMSGSSGSAPDRHDRHVVAAPAPVAVEDARDQRGMAAGQAGVALDLPAADAPVGVHDEERGVGPRVGDLVDAAGVVPGGTVTGDEVPGRVARDDRPPDVADPRVGDHAPGGIDARHRHRGAPAPAERVMDHRHLLGGRPLRRGLEAGDREASGVRGPGPVAEAVDDHHARTREAGGHREAIPPHVLTPPRYAHPPGLHRESARLAPAVRVDPRQDRGTAGLSRIHVHERRETVHRPQPGARAARGGV